jgi:hypothetical protein
MMLIRGSDLGDHLQREVLSMYVHRLTQEMAAVKVLPTDVRASYPTDADWLVTHAFWVTKRGELARNRRYAEPAFLVEIA